jgi:hypothetical protein
LKTQPGKHTIAAAWRHFPWKQFKSPLEIFRYHAMLLELIHHHSKVKFDLDETIPAENYPEETVVGREGILHRLNCSTFDELLRTQCGDLGGTLSLVDVPK